MAAGGNEAIIVKKVINVAGGHHGGAWKVAYADFVTAMMAFFLLLWLLNVTTDEQKHGIADYFAPKSVSRSNSGSGGLMGGISMATEGARISQNAPPTVVVELSPPRQRKPTDEEQNEAGGDLDEDELLKQMAEREQKQFEQAEQQIRQAIQESPVLVGMANSLIIDNTPEGLRIQLVDQARQTMFPSGSTELDERAKQLMQQIATVVQRMPNRISITGHTDALPFRTRSGYGNWELSADRANASRRALLDAGLDAQRIAYVTGKAETEPLIPEDPANPSNRRISIVLLREAQPTPPSGG
jgi:chemotaxis protein MotB